MQTAFATTRVRPPRATVLVPRQGVPFAPRATEVAASGGAVGRIRCRSGGSRRWGVIEGADRGDIVVGVPPLPVAILLRVDQPALFESFQGGGADPHLVGRLSNAHMHLLFRGFSILSGSFAAIPDHVPPAGVRPQPR